MLKNKIYKYFFKEILKNFITILLTFTTIAWVVKAVNFLDLMVEDGYGSSIYFKYSILNITTIITRFIPLSFLLSLTVSIIKFERQKEFLILWTTGLSKIKIVNIFLVISFIITFLQLVLALFLNPFLLNKSRYLLSNTQNLQINTVLKSNDFNDTFKGITFFIDNKNDNNELENIFIKDSTGILNIVVDEFNNKKNSTIIAEKGYISDDDKLILFDGMIQTLNEKNQIKNILFKKTELSLGGISTRTIKQPKIQETSTKILLNCALGLVEDLNLKNCSKSYKNESIQNLSRRSGAPLYIPLITIVTSFLLINKKDKIYNFFRRYILFIFSFVLLVFAEIALKYTGLSNIVGVSYFVAPIIISFFFYILLIKKIMIEKK